MILSEYVTILPQSKRKLKSAQSDTDTQEYAFQAFPGFVNLWTVAL